MGTLRLILALSVLISHTGPLWGLTLFEAVTAVKSFYIVSGFYMALVLSTKYNAPKSLRYFYFNRFVRIYPLYYLVLVINILTVLVTGNHHILLDIGHLPWPSFFLILGSTLSIVGLDWLYFLRMDEVGNFYYNTYLDGMHSPIQYNMLGQTWSVAVECTFYLFAPFFARRRFRFLLLTTIALLVIREWCARHLNLVGDPWSHRFFPFELPLFLIGMMAYRVYAHISTRPTWLLLPGRFTHCHFSREKRDDLPDRMALSAGNPAYAASVYAQQAFQAG